jgi:hypothetical protein
MLVVRNSKPNQYKKLPKWLKKIVPSLAIVGS